MSKTRFAVVFLAMCVMILCTTFLSVVYLNKEEVISSSVDENELQEAENENHNNLGFGEEAEPEIVELMIVNSNNDL